MKQDPYAVLGLQRCACADEVRKAYRELARRYHPDVSGDPETAKQFRKVTEAYQQICQGQCARPGEKKPTPPEPYRGPGPAPFADQNAGPSWWVIDGAGPFHHVTARRRPAPPPDEPLFATADPAEPLIPPKPQARPSGNSPLDLDLMMQMLKKW